jgi:hypothetical protein
VYAAFFEKNHLPCFLLVTMTRRHQYDFLLEIDIHPLTYLLLYFLLTNFKNDS